MRFLDIGSDEGPREGPEWIHLDIKHTPLCDEMFGFRTVDVIADAHNLPFAERTFDHVYSGACLFEYTEASAFLEALRVLKENRTLELRVHLEALPRTIEACMNAAMIVTNIEVLNVYDDGVHDLKVEVCKRVRETQVLIHIGKTEPLPGFHKIELVELATLHPQSVRHVRIEHTLGSLSAAGKQDVLGDIYRTLVKGGTLHIIDTQHECVEAVKRAGFRLFLEDYAPDLDAFEWFFIVD